MKTKMFGLKRNLWCAASRLIGSRVPAFIILLTTALAQLADADPCTPPPAGLIGWWRAENNANDSAGGHNGTTPFGMTYSTGEVGQAFTYTFVNSDMTRVTIPDCPDFALTNSLTIEGWIYPKAACFYVFFRGDDRAGWDPYFVDCNTVNMIGFGITTSDNTIIHITAPIQYNQWQHFAATLDGATSTMNLYVNGVLSGQTNTTLRPLANLDPAYNPALGIGNVGGTAQTWPFNGFIDEISLYSRALNPSEIQSIYAAGSAGKCLFTPPTITSQSQGTVGYWGGTVQFGVGVDGTPPFSYQWYKENFSISWGTNSTLTLTNLDFPDGGNYWVAVTNLYGGTNSASALLVVNPAGVWLGTHPFLTITGTVGKNFGIEYTTQVSQTNSWTVLTNFTLTQPVQEWIDTSVDAVVTQQRFYRVVPIP